MPLTTRLEAVNTILGASGESPVDALSNTTADSANAEAILDEITREVQSEGWHFNTEDKVPLTPDSAGEIPLPTNVLNVDVDPAKFPEVDPIQRGSRLYDKTARRYTFTKALEAEIVYLLPWDELPEVARRFITVRAARVFHARFVGDQATHSYTQDDELRARIALADANVSNADNNLFVGNPAFQRVLARR